MNPYRIIAKKLRSYRDTADITQAELSSLVTEILRPETVAAYHLKRLRTVCNLTQQEMTTLVNTFLHLIDSVGMPTRMATSKVENARRRLDFLEAMAICIALEIPPWALLPESLQKLQPKLSIAKLWIFKRQYQGCYLFEHVCSETRILTLCITPQLNLKQPEGKKHLDLDDIIINNPWCKDLISTILANPMLNPTPMDLTVTSSGELKWTTLP